MAQHQFPLPIITAIVSVYAQAIAGVLFLIAWKVRLAALVMVINFLIAIIMVHWGQSFEEMTTVLFMIVTSATLFFTGAGEYAVDER